MYYVIADNDVVIATTDYENIAYQIAKEFTSENCEVRWGDCYGFAPHKQYKYAEN